MDLSLDLNDNIVVISMGINRLFYFSHMVDRAFGTFRTILSNAVFEGWCLFPFPVYAAKEWNEKYMKVKLLFVQVQTSLISIKYALIIFYYNHLHIWINIDFTLSAFLAHVCPWKCRHPGSFAFGALKIAKNAFFPLVGRLFLG